VSEVDLARYGRMFLRRAWVIALCTAVGTAIGVAASRTATHHQSQARTTLYLGQPITPQGGVIPGTLNQNPDAVNVFTAESDVQRIAEHAAGLPAGALQGHVSSGAITASLAAAATGRANPIFQITVQGPWSPLVVQRAAASLTGTVLARTSVYAIAKMQLANQQIAVLQARIAQVQHQSSQAESELLSLPAGAGQASVRAPALMQLIATNASVEAQLTALLDTAQLNTLQAQQIEASRLLTSPVGRRISSVARSTSVGAGFAAGLIVGIVVAAASLYWRPARGGAGRSRA
jgi:hypothetical protein